MNHITIRALFCTRSRCSESAFERRSFWRGLYRHAVPLALLIQMFSPSFFRDDRAFIEYVGGDANLAELREDIARFESRNRVSHHWLRTGLRIRVSSARVAALAHRCFAA